MRDIEIKKSDKRYGLLWICLFAFAVTVLFVNPVRETAVGDEWAYALTTKHLLETGEYRPHEWVTANMPFQAYWNALFAHLFGYSFSIFRISTLALFLIGLVAFYGLAKEHKLDNTQAGLLTLGLLSSPLVLHLTFSFMTDIPFLSCLIVALLLYTRAIKTRSYSLMLTASVAASATILTRMFGAALVAGLFCLWILCKERKNYAGLFLTGMALPVLVTLAQIYMTVIFMPTCVQQMQLEYLDSNSRMLLGTLWRPVGILHYLALFCLPFVLLALLDLAFDMKKRGVTKFKWMLLGLLSTYILSGTLLEEFIPEVPQFMPYMPFHFGVLERLSDLERGSLTVVTLIGAILFARIFALRYCDPSWGKTPPNERLLDFVTLFFLILNLLFFQICDRYVLVFLPFALIVLGRHLGDWLNRLAVVTVIACLVMLTVSAMWTRGALEKSEAMWKATELVRGTGVEPGRIYGTWEWINYYTFDEYLEDIDYRWVLLTDYWDRWLPERYARARFVVVECSEPPSDEEWNVAARVPYRDMLLRERQMCALERDNQLTA